MKDTNNYSLQVAVAKLQLLAENAVFSLQTMQAELSLLTQSIAVSNPTDVTVGGDTDPKPVKQKDRSKFYFQGTWYNKRNFALAILKQYADKQMPMAELEALFQEEKVFPSPFRGNKKVFKRAQDVTGNEKSRFHPDALTTKDGKSILVTNQVGIDNFPQLLVYLAKTFGFPIKGKDLNRDLWPAFDGYDVTYLNE